jgi:hypothetical protein
LRTRRTVGLLVVATAACLAIATASGCGGDSNRSNTPPRSEYVGVVVDIEGEGSNVRAFTLESGSDTIRLLIAPGVDYGFDLGHLRDHMATRDPVRCPVRQRGGRLYALAIADA